MTNTIHHKRETMPTRVKLMFGSAAAVLALSMMASTGAMAQNASFNCRYARTPNEVAICNSPMLRALDRRMASLYSMRMGALDGDEQPTMAEAQQEWLAVRKDCRSSGTCLQNVYREQIRRLRENRILIAEGGC